MAGYQNRVQTIDLKKGIQTMKMAQQATSNIWNSRCVLIPAPILAPGVPTRTRLESSIQMF